MEAAKDGAKILRRIREDTPDTVSNRGRPPGPAFPELDDTLIWLIRVWLSGATGQLWRTFAHNLATELLANPEKSQFRLSVRLARQLKQLGGSTGSTESIKRRLRLLRDRIAPKTEK